MAFSRRSGCNWLLAYKEVIHLLANSLCAFLSDKPLDKVKSQINRRRDAASRHHIALVHYSLIYDLPTESFQLLKSVRMRGRSSSCEKSRRA